MKGPPQSAGPWLDAGVASTSKFSLFCCFYVWSQLKGAEVMQRICVRNESCDVSHFSSVGSAPPQRLYTREAHPLTRPPRHALV